VAGGGGDAKREPPETLDTVQMSDCVWFFRLAIMPVQPANRTT
jgi:hypothetical protein